MDARLKDVFGSCFSRARVYVSEFLKSKASDVPFQHPELRELMLYHPGRKVKDFVYFSKKAMPPYNKACLTVMMPDRHVHVVSWVHCLQKLYGKSNPERNRKARALQAFREEISLSPKMVEARDKYGQGQCQVCKKKAKLDIDHDVKPFAMLLDEFLEEKSLSLTKVTLDFRSRPLTLMSRKLASQWVDYHDENATLIGLCKACNCSKGSGGYRHKILE
jgi:hypothetical protein